MSQACVCFDVHNVMGRSDSSSFESNVTVCQSELFMIASAVFLIRDVDLPSIDKERHLDAEVQGLEPELTAMIIYPA